MQRCLFKSTSTERREKMTVTSWTFGGATELSSYVILLAIFVGAPITVVVALSKTQHSRLKCIYY
eukprot:scaffold5405_cov114-Skeletonema_marinoi.AAC.3